MNLRSLLPLSLFMWLPVVLSAQSFSELTFQVADFKHAESSYSFLDSLEIMYNEPNWKDLNVGFSLELELSEKDNIIYLTPLSQGIKLESFLIKLNEIVAAYPSKLYPVFLEYEGFDAELKELISHSCGNQHYFQNKDLAWPSDIQLLISQNQNIIFFDQSVSDKPEKFLNYSGDHIAELPFTSFFNPVFTGSYSRGTIQNELLMLRHFSDSLLDNSNLPGDWRDLNSNSIVPDYIKICWMKTGKRPNFLFYENLNYWRTFSWIQTVIDSSPYILGDIETSGNILNKIPWKNEWKSITHNRFCFPVIEDNIILSPYHLGVVFAPENYSLNISNLPKEISFRARAMDLESKISAYFPFNGDLKNKANHSDKGKNFGCTFHSSLEKGQVLDIKQGDYVEFSPVKEYGLVNSDFTISTYVKVLEAFDRDVALLGTNDKEYRKGLHIVLRNSMPYAGFFRCDISTDTVVDCSNWNHLVFRYEHWSKEQTVFLNGKLLNRRGNHPSFIGKSNFLVGKAFGNDSTFSGYLNDIIIWERALSDEEISILYDRGINEARILQYEPSKGSGRDVMTGLLRPISVVIILFVILIVVLAVIFIYRRQSNTVQQKSLSLKKKEQVEDFKNAIFLFGNFTIYDRTGTNITANFPPKVKELFLLICFNTAKSNKGVSSEQLTSILWPGFTATKAANNRGVTFNKLRKALKDLEGISIVFDNDFWRVEYTSEVQFDFIEVLNDLKNMNELSEEQLAQFFQHVKRGQLLHRLQWSWMEEFKDDITFDIVDALLLYADKLKVSDNTTELYKVCKHILSIDDLNELALHMQLNLLVEQGNMNKAHHIMDRFKEKYQESYGEEYEHSIKDLTSREK